MKLNLSLRGLLILLLFIPLLSTAQTSILKGVLKDADTQAAVAGATVTVKSNDYSATAQTTDIGSFEIKNLPYGKYTINFLSEGFESVTVEADVNQPTVDLATLSLPHLNADPDQIPTVSMNDSEVKESASSSVSGVLTSSRDPFESASAFIFSTARFRARGYQNEDMTYMNGLPMEDLVSGRGLFGTWGGLNDVIRSRESSYGLNPSTYGYGGLNGSSSIDARASRQRKQLSVGYAISNRTYDNRLMATYGTGMMQGGWSFSASVSRRWADEGYIAGTFYNGWSWYASIEKRFNTKHSISLTQFGANTENGRASAAVQEVYDLAGTHYYNPNWGYQDGEKRTASVGHQQSPLTILNHEWKINSKSELETSVGYQFGSNSVTGLDWFNAPDPRPDFYRNLPSYIVDPTMAAYATSMWQNDEAYRQIKWDRMYDVNRNNYETITDANGVSGNNVYGRRSRYIVEERVQDTKRVSFASTYNNTLSDHVIMTAGVNYQFQQTDYYKRVNDLLGGDFYVDLNQFADQEYPDSVETSQNDLNNPNHVLQVGDKFGYNYRATIKRTGVWIQPQFKFNRIDAFVGVQYYSTSYYRTGFVRNGIFADNSEGKSTEQSFNNLGVKGGLTYKLNGRNYVFVNGSYENRPPLFEDVYVSPRTRDLTNPNITDEKIMSFEGGYLFRAPKTKIRATAYYTQYNDAMNTMSFYHEDYRTFVNYSLSNIDKRHVGIEFGAEQNLGKGIYATAAVAVGQYYYTDRMKAIITQDNTNEVLNENETIYSKNFYVSGGPQSAYTAGLRYQTKTFWRFNLNASYFDKIFLDFNPTRRTIDGVAPYGEGPIREALIDQLQADGQFMLDASVGKSWKLNNYFKSMKNQTFFLINVGVNNILNNQDLVTNGFEQLRFDFADKNTYKYAPKSYYAFGTNYFINFTLRFN
jgi:hypothetical protein